MTEDAAKIGTHCGVPDADYLAGEAEKLVEPVSSISPVGTAIDAMGVKLNEATGEPQPRRSMNIVKIDRAHSDQADDELEIDLNEGLAYACRRMIDLKNIRSFTKQRKQLVAVLDKIAVVNIDKLDAAMQLMIIDYARENAKGKAKYAELNLEAAHRPELNVRLSTRAQQDTVEVTDADALMAHYKRTGELKEGTSPFKLVPAHYELSKDALNAEAKRRDAQVAEQLMQIAAGKKIKHDDLVGQLPGVVVKHQPDKGYFKEV